MRLLKVMTALLFDPDFRLSGLAEIRNRTRSIQPTMRRMPGSSLMRVRISSGEPVAKLGESSKNTHN